MKILARTLDEIKKDKATYDEALGEYNRKMDEAGTKYYKTVRSILDPIVTRIEFALGNLPLLDLEVKADTDADYADGKLFRFIQVKVECNQRRIHDETSALAWIWEVHVDNEGNVVKESSSWSGMKATTDEQLESLGQTYEALKTLNELDWVELLKKELPQERDFYDDTLSRPQQEYDYDAEMKVAELEENIVDKPVMVEIASEANSHYRTNAWAAIRSATPKFYEYCRITDYNLKNYREAFNSVEEFLASNEPYWTKIKKVRFAELVVQPVNYLDWSEN